jgi:hypothetical protein
MTAEELAERFDISVGAARIRLDELAKIRRRATGEERPLPQSVIQYLEHAEKNGYRLRKER